MEVERTVQRVKSLLQKTEDLYLILLAYRHTGVNRLQAGNVANGMTAPLSSSAFPSILVPEDVNNKKATKMYLEAEQCQWQNYQLPLKSLRLHTRL